jgi:ElaB/YqjD/DUF883 family membrane-anchored ribosome-binding protein
MTNFAIDLGNFSVSKLSSSALIVNLSLSVWTGRKLDKRVSEEVDQQNSTKTRAGNYHKNLLAGSGKLTEITKIANATRSWLYGVTQPWGDNGDRILNMAYFMEFKDRLADYEGQFSTAVNSFLSDYDTLVAAAAFQLGDLFNREDYPTRETIEAKFGFRYNMIPLPQAGDFRVDIGEDGLRELQAQYESVLQQRVTGAMTEAWERLHDCLSRMSERLTDDTDSNGDPKRKIFRDSLIENAVEVCGLLKSFNITGDTRMDEMRKQLEDAMRGVNADALRDSDSLREQTKRKVDNILSKFDI